MPSIKPDVAIVLTAPTLIAPGKPICCTDVTAWVKFWSACVTIVTPPPASKELSFGPAGKYALDLNGYEGLQLHPFGRLSAICATPVCKLSMIGTHGCAGPEQSR